MAAKPSATLFFAVICLSVSATLIQASIESQTEKAKAAAADESQAFPAAQGTEDHHGRELKQFGGSIAGFTIPRVTIPGGIPGISGGGNGGSGGGGNGGSGGDSQCDTTLDVGNGHVTQPYSVSATKKDCFILESRAWHIRKGLVSVPAFVRALFHDCFTGRCDGSLFLSKKEREAGENKNILSSRVMQEYRNYIRTTCNVAAFSYADAIRLGAATGIEAAAGPVLSHKIILGKRDSQVAENTTLLPKADVKMPGQVALFQRVMRVNASTAIKYVVALQGAHTLGFAKCQTFRARARGEDNLPNNLRIGQQAGCINDCIPFPWDATPLTFDNQYYQAIVLNSGLLTSDQTMLSNRFCSAGVCGDTLVRSYANNKAAWFRAWEEAFLALCRRTF